MSKWWHVLASVGIAALGVVLPSLQTVVLHHPVVTTILGTLWTILGSVLPSPVQKP